MKKTKILTVLGVLLAMGITACGGNKTSSKSEEKSSQSSQPASSVQPSSEAPASSVNPSSAPDTSIPEQGSSSSSSAVAHVHVWNLPNKDELQEEFAEVDEQPTCTTAGRMTWYCECGETKTETIKKLGHDFGEWEETTPATCTVDGEKTRSCSRCDATETEVIPAGHKYGDPETVAAAGDGVEYTKEVCSVDQTIRIKVNQSQVTYASGSSRKSATPDGYTKLNGDGQSMSFKFNYTHFAVGQLYLFGRMDGWSTSGNQSAGFYRQGTPSIEVKVNNSIVDISAQQGKTYLDYFGEHDNETGLDSPSDHLSDEGYAPVGPIVLVEGVNELVYKRVQTQNMIIKDFVFVIQDSEHVHEAAATYSSDETQHWHACTALGCPTGKADTPANHEFGEQYDIVAATCSAKGSYKQKCSVCDYVKTVETDKIAHTYGEAYDIVAATCEAAGSQKKKCSVCDDVLEEVLPKLDHTFGDAVENYAAVTEGENQHVAETAHNCSVCNNAAIRWAATAYDVTKSTERSTAVPESRDSNKAIRFSSTPNYSGGDATVKGCHIVYNVSIPADATNVGLAVYSTKRNDINTVFAKNEGDSSKGYEYVDGQLVRPDSRYGLKVDGQVIILNADSQTWKADTKAWYEFPVVIPSLTAGVHEIEIYNLGGYRADFYEFELTNLPHIESSHTHNGGDAWVTDENNHWHVCTAEGCPIADGKYDSAAHDFGEVQVVTPATCTEKGAGTKTCSVCGKVVDVEIAALGHNYAPTGEVTVDGTKASQTWVCSVCSDSKTYTGGVYGTCKWSDAKLSGALSSGKFASGVTYEFAVFNVPSAGTYTLTLNIKGSAGNGAKVLNGDGQGFEVKANGNAATFLGNGLTYEQFIGEDQASWVDVAFAEVVLQEGYNVITIKALTGYYRLSANESGNFSLAPKA